MKRYLTLVLLAVLLVCLLLPTGCFWEDGTSLTEMEVCCTLSSYLLDKYHQLEGWETQIEWRFVEELLDAWREALMLPIEEHAEGDAKYLGNGWWRIELSTTCWRVNEDTNQVQPEGEATVQLMEAITLKTYCNSEYGYCVNYPPLWAVNDENKRGVLIFRPDFEANVFIEVTEQYFEDFEHYVAVKSIWLVDIYYEFDVTDADRGYPVWRIDYTYTHFPGGQRWDSKHYFVLHGGLVYEVVSSAVQNASGVSLLPDAYKSFRFEP